MRILKLGTFLFLLTVFVVVAVILRFYAVTPVNKRRVSSWWTHKMCKTGVWLFGLDISSTGKEYLEPGGKLIISNHMSYLDIIVYASIRPSVFVSSVEMQKTPVLGFLAKLGPTFFVERRDPKLIKLEIGKMAELVSEGFNVFLFPEGTSTDGSEILPFRSSLLASASSGNVEVVPSCIKYTEIDGKEFSPENCDYVCWYGDMSFAPHLWGLLSTRNIKVKATYFEPIDSGKMNRKVITQRAHELITKEYFAA